jgi:uncharacterized membrane protein YkvI
LLAAALAFDGAVLLIWLALSLSRLEKAAHSTIAVQASVFMVAIVWDFLMSGKHVTNRDSQRVPRTARVLMYVGYVMLVCAAVLSYTSMHTASAPNEGFGFSAEGIVSQGIEILGVAILLATILLHYIGANERPRADEGGPGE